MFMLERRVFHAPLRIRPKNQDPREGSRFLSSMSAVVVVEDVAHDGIIFGSEILVDLVESIGLDDLVRDDDFVLGAEIDTFLGLLDAADDAAGNAQAPEDQGPLHHLMRRTHDAQLNDSSVQSQQRKVVGNLRDRGDSIAVCVCVSV